MTRSGLFALLAFTFAAAHAASANAPADTVYRNGYIYTVDAKDSVQQALAVRGGRIVYVGNDAGAAKLQGQNTTVIDLGGKMLMPGLIDGHMHPQSGGSRLLNCSLDYAPLTVPQFQQRLQACIDSADRLGTADPKRWLVVVNWFQQGMLPDGVATTAATLDALQTDRPILVRSSFGHSLLLNSKGIAVAGITAATSDPAGGKIARDAGGQVTGLLEDAAQDMAMNLLPPLTVAENLAASTKALEAMRRQGITSFLDAYTDPETMTAFTDLQRQGKLTARAHFAVLIDLDKGSTPQRAVADLLKQKKQFDQGPTTVAPSLQVRHAKLFMDGVISAPAPSSRFPRAATSPAASSSCSTTAARSPRSATHWSARALPSTLAASASSQAPAWMK